MLFNLIPVTTTDASPTSPTHYAHHINEISYQYAQSRTTDTSETWHYIQIETSEAMMLYAER
jgi:hypothetical protein